MFNAIKIVRSFLRTNSISVLGGEKMENCCALKSFSISFLFFERGALNKGRCKKYNQKVQGSKAPLDQHSKAAICFEKFKADLRGIFKSTLINRLFTPTHTTHRGY